LVVPAMTLKKCSAGSPSVMKVRPAGTDMGPANAARRCRSAPWIVAQTLTLRASQEAHGCVTSRTDRGPASMLIISSSPTSCFRLARARGHRNTSGSPQ
jgi:hypothetical protein